MSTRPNLQDDGWELESAVARQQKYPHSFHIPNHDERTNLREGERVQLLFLILTKDDDGAQIVQSERLWVTVKEIRNGRYLGWLESQPQTSDVLKSGSLITFGPEHVAAIFVRRDDPRHPNYKLQ